jgi:hypothetical protein
MTTLNSEGKCLFCGETYKKAAISRHLNTHLKAKAAANKIGVSFHLRIEAEEMFLNLWVDGEAKMKSIDDFLRSIWLECCGHMSAFRDRSKASRGGGMFDIMDAYDYLEQGNIKKYEAIMESTAGEVPMSRKVKDVFYKDYKLEYQYDFGSTTQLKVKAIEVFPFKAEKSIVLLSRNEPLEILCHDCGKSPASKICTVCMGEDEYMFCDKCAKKHAKKCPDFDDYAQLPVVNSPRMGVCAYEGGIIDIERDGIFVLKTD